MVRPREHPRNILAPSRIDEIICNGCQRVRLAGPDIDLSIPISIACYPEINGRKKLRVARCPCPTPYQARAGHPIVQHLECSNQFGFEQRSARSEEHTSELQSLMRISYAVSY